MSKYLRIMRILDVDGNLSVTNIAMYLVLGAGLFIPVNVYFGISIVALYGFGRWLHFKRGQIVDAAMKTLLNSQAEMQKQLNIQKDQITSLSMKAGIQTSVASLDIAKMRRF